MIAPKKLLLALSTHCLFLCAHNNLFNNSIGTVLILFPKSIFLSVSVTAKAEGENIPLQHLNFGGHITQDLITQRQNLLEQGPEVTVANQ